MDKKIPARKQVFFNIKILLLITQLQQPQGLPASPALEVITTASNAEIASPRA